MSRPSVAFAVWGLYLLGLGAILWFVFFADALSFVLPAVAAGATFAIALLAVRPETRSPEVERLPETSVTAPVAALGLTLVVLGLALGEWLVLIGAGLLGLALGMLVRERPR